jgi:signal transduction histidine kinase
MLMGTLSGGPKTPDRAGTPGSSLEAPERRLEIWLRMVPFVLLIMSMIPYLVTQRPSAGDVGRTAALAALAAAWVAWWVPLHPGWAANRVLMSVYYLGFLAFSALLVARSPWFAFFCWIGYLHAYRFLTGPARYIGLIGTAAISAVAQLGGFHRPTLAGWVIFAVVACLNATLVTAFIYLGAKAEEQNQARKRMIVELAGANRRLEEMMAENTGLHAQLLSQAREAGVLEERQRMAREIHDTLAQGLAGIITQLEAAQQARGRAAGRPGEPSRPGEAGPGGPGGPATGHGAEWERRVRNATRLARDSLSEARRSVRAVRPEALEDTRLPDALAEVADRWSAVNGVPATVTTTGTGQGLHPEVEVTLLRVAQEALANVAKHAGASRVGLTLSYMDDVVTLDVRDDGVGFRLPAEGPGASGGPGGPGEAGRASSGFGLTTMRQRVRRLTGQLEIESEPGGGTAVSASVPAILRATPAAARSVLSSSPSPAGTESAAGPSPVRTERDLASSPSPAGASGA